MPDPGLPFDRLIVTPGNELAIRAARAVAEAPGALYNPLIVQGPPGVGKSELLRAIAARTLACEPGRSVLLQGADRLVELVTTGVAGGSLSTLRDALTGVDTLLLDDFERLAGMERTQEEVAGVFAEMLVEGRQIVLAAREPEPGAEPFIPALRELLADALVVEIEPMEVAARERVVHRLARERRLELGDDVVRLLATSSSGDLGEIDRTVARLAESSERTGDPVTLDDLYALLAEGAEVADPEDEFGSFLEEVTRSLSVVVETAPWRRRIAQVILHWESEGIRTRRLDEAIRADTPPDVDELIEGFARDAARLLEIRSALGDHPRATYLDDPDDLPEGERLLRSLSEPDAMVDARAATEAFDADEEEPADPSFLDPERVVLDWVGVAERLAGGTR